MVELYIWENPFCQIQIDPDYQWYNQSGSARLIRTINIILTYMYLTWIDPDFHWYNLSGLAIDWSGLSLIPVYLIWISHGFIWTINDITGLDLTWLIRTINKALLSGSDMDEEVTYSTRKVIFTIRSYRIMYQSYGIVGVYCSIVR